MVVGAVAAAVLTSRPEVNRGAAYAICKILTVGFGDCGGSPVADPHRPTEPCVTSQNSVSQSYEGLVGVVHIGAGQD